MKSAVSSIALAAALSVLVGGCSYSSTRTALRVGGWVMLTGATTAMTGAGICLAAGTQDCEAGPSSQRDQVTAGYGVGVLGLIIIATGALIGAGGLIRLDAYDSPEEAPLEAERVRSAPVVDRSECLARRRQLSIQAQATDDLALRARILASLPNCEPVVPVRE